MTTLNGKIALVTGASAGIGFAVTEGLAKLGVIVVACARNIQSIQDLSEKFEPDVIHAVKCDMTKEEEVMQLFQEIRDKYGKLDILINNAGMGGSKTGLLDGQYEDWEVMLKLNVLAMTLASRESVKLMQLGGSNSGHIVIMNAIGAHIIPAHPLRQFYAGTKHMLLAVTEALRRNVQPMNIRVTTISPGVVETEFAQRSYGKGDPAMAATLYTRFKPLETKDIVDVIAYALSAPQHVNIDEIIMTPTAVIY